MSQGSQPQEDQLPGMCRDVAANAAALVTTTQVYHAFFSSIKTHLKDILQQVGAPHVNLPQVICQIVYQFSDIVGVYHMPFQQLKILCLCQNSKFLLIYDMIQNQTSNL